MALPWQDNRHCPPGIDCGARRTLAFHQQARADAHLGVRTKLAVVPDLNSQHVLASLQPRREIDRVEPRVHRLAGLRAEAHRFTVDEEPVTIVRGDRYDKAGGCTLGKRQTASEKRDTVPPERDADRRDPAGIPDRVGRQVIRLDRIGCILGRGRAKPRK